MPFSVYSLREKTISNHQKTMANEHNYSSLNQKHIYNNIERMTIQRERKTERQREREKKICDIIACRRQMAMSFDINSITAIPLIVQCDMPTVTVDRLHLAE